MPSSATQGGTIEIGRNYPNTVTTFRRQSICIWLVLCFALFVATACGAPPEPTSTPRPTATIDPIVAEGATLFSEHCAICHSAAPGVIGRGPTMAGMAPRAATRVEGQDAYTYLRNSIIRPGEFVVPEFEDVMLNNFGTKLTSSELDVLITYLLTFE